jgi:hypothetical protein
MLVALTERDQDLHNHVEVVVEKITEEHTYFQWWQLEVKVVAMDGLDDS